MSSAGPFDRIWSQSSPVRVIERAIETGRLASAYLFEGKGGVGKERLALATARAVLGEAAWPRVEAGMHPDVRIFRPRDEGSRNLPVDLVREEILPVTNFAPFEAKSAFLIFPEADVSFPQAHSEAANALLKTLEEPRPGVHFILLSERPERLLPTIRSRTQSLRLAPLPASTLARILKEHGHSDPAIALAGGRADRALALAEEGAAQALLERAAAFDLSLAKPRPGDLVDLAEGLARETDLPLLLETLITFYRDVACASVGMPAAAFSFRQLADTAQARAKQLGAGAAARRAALLADVTRQLERNANRGLALDRLVSQLRCAR
ncbi:MAG: hypothetical protein GXP55_24870 [Deltaproteobacteria bacterium]|nr:hypothetical protein [Deltaproteobacteria bacterium]